MVDIEPVSAHRGLRARDVCAVRTVFFAASAAVCAAAAAAACAAATSADLAACAGPSPQTPAMVCTLLL